MAGSVLKNLKMFASLCGQKAMPNVSLVTTMWADVKEETGIRREEELMRDFWKGMVDDGCKTERFQHTYESAWNIVGTLSEKERAQVQLPTEMVEIHLPLNETQAGITLNRELEQLIKDRKHAARKLRQQAENQNNELVVQELNQRKAEIDEKILQTADELRQLKIPFTRRVRLFFLGRRT
jgi:chromosome condensin MukBEF ATPase and DNA-binding subunit MukB